MPYEGHSPGLGRDVWIADGSYLIGAVQIGDHSSVWYQCVLRGDLQPVLVGHHTNIQDGTVCHVGSENPCVVGNYVTVGHRVILHGCRVGDEVLIGMGAVIMNGVGIGEQTIIGAAALVTEGAKIPAGSLVYGAPAKVISHLGPKERGELRQLAEEYCDLAARHRSSHSPP